MLFYHDTDEIANLGFNFGSENTGSPYATTGFYLSANKILYNLYWKGSSPNASAINVLALENKNWYKMTATISSNISYKLNKMTIVDNVVTAGSDINSSSTAVGTQTPYATLGVFGLLTSNNASNYSSQHRIAYLKFYTDNDTLIYDFQFSQNGGTKIFNLVDGTSYQISNINESLFYNYTQDFVHTNYTHGFTKYIKTGSRDILVSNSNSGTQITTTESGYTVVRNVGKCETIWNGCESKVKFDDVNIMTLTVSGALTPSGYNGNYVQNGEWAGNPKFDKIGDSTKNIWKSGSPYDVYGWSIGDITSQSYWFEYIDGDGDDKTPIPSDVDTFSPFGFVGATGNVTVTLNQADEILESDKNNIWFDESGIAKEVKLGTDFTCDGIDSSNECFMFINDINNYDTKNFYIFSEDKILGTNTRILQKIGMGDVIVFDNGKVVYDGNYTVTDYTITF